MPTAGPTHGSTHGWELEGMVWGKGLMQFGAEPWCRVSGLQESSPKEV